MLTHSVQARQRRSILFHSEAAKRAKMEVELDTERADKKDILVTLRQEQARNITSRRGTRTFSAIDDKEN